MQDNPEVEKRDPQELVGEYPGAGGGEPHAEPTGFQPRRWLLSASAKAAALLLSQGLWHFLRRLGKTPREQFFFDRFTERFTGLWSVASVVRRDSGPPSAGSSFPLCPASILRPCPPTAPSAGIFTGSRSKHVASAGTLLCPQEGTGLTAPGSGALCGTGQGSYISGK